MNVSHKMDSNLNISPKMSYGVLECDNVVTEWHAYDFVIKDFYVIKGALFVPNPIYIYLLKYVYHTIYTN